MAVSEGAAFSVIGTAATLAAGAAVARVNPPAVRLIAIDADDIGVIRPGEATRAAGLFALRSLQAAAAAVQVGDIDAIVYVPLNKHAMKLAGFAAVDEMHYLAALFGCNSVFTELNQLDNLWTTRVMLHVRLKDVASLITERRITEATLFAVDTMRRAGIARYDLSWRATRRR